MFRKGLLKANEILLLGKKLNAQEALQAGLLNDIFSDTELLPQVLKIAKQVAESPPQALLETKQVFFKLNIHKIYVAP